MLNRPGVNVSDQERQNQIDALIRFRRNHQLENPGCTCNVIAVNPDTENYDITVFTNPGCPVHGK